MMLLLLFLLLLLATSPALTVVVLAAGMLSKSYLVPISETDLGTLPVMEFGDGEDKLILSQSRTIAR